MRSKKLLEILANDEKIIETHGEDHHICRTYGNYLKSLGIKFATDNIAKNFSLEGFSSHPAIRGKNWTNQFGFHGLHKTDISNWKDYEKFFGEKYDFSKF